MEKNNKLKSLVSIIIIFVAVLVVLYVSLFFRKENSINYEENTNISTNSKSFKEWMDKLYTSYNIENNNCYSYAEDSTYWCSYDNSGIVTCSVSTYADGISIFLNDTYQNKYVDIAEDITGITEEVVSIKIVEFTDIAYPREIYFLTREGNVYYLNSESLEKEEYIANKLNDIKNVISIEKIGVHGEEHDDVAAIATTFEGDKILLSPEFSGIKLK